MPTAEGGPRTLYDKVFQDHIVDERLDGTILLYIGTYTVIIHSTHPDSLTDRHLVHEVTSPVSTLCYCVPNTH
jgi:3-isopropylmalate dehydratase